MGIQMWNRQTTGQARKVGTVYYGQTMNGARQIITAKIPITIHQ